MITDWLWVMRRQINKWCHHERKFLFFTNDYCCDWICCRTCSQLLQPVRVKHMNPNLHHNLVSVRKNFCPAGKLFLRKVRRRATVGQTAAGCYGCQTERGAALCWATRGDHTSHSSGVALWTHPAASQDLLWTHQCTHCSWNGTELQSRHCSVKLLWWDTDTDETKHLHMNILSVGESEQQVTDSRGEDRLTHPRKLWGNLCLAVWDYKKCNTWLFFFLSWTKFCTRLLTSTRPHRWSFKTYMT